MKMVRRTQYQLMQTGGLAVREPEAPHHWETAREPRDRSSRHLVIAMLKERDGNACYLCGKTFPEGRQPCIEHIIPLGMGGENEPSNVALACFSCNVKKGTNIVSFSVSSRRPFYAHPSSIGRRALVRHPPPPTR